jgi:hypothetical protein
MIGHGDGWHAEFRCAVGEFRSADHAIEKGVGCMKVKMNEGI